MSVEGIARGDRLTREQVRALRAFYGFTQEQFAQAIGVTLGSLQRWESGRARPSRLAQASLERWIDAQAAK